MPRQRSNSVRHEGQLLHYYHSKSASVLPVSVRKALLSMAADSFQTRLENGNSVFAPMFRCLTDEAT